jgi:ribosomal-protein-alanine N-acetyltransferase
MRLNDAQAYYEYLSNSMVNKYLSDEDIPRDVNEALECVKTWGSLFYNKQGIFWTIADAETDRLIGSIGISGWNFLSARAEISYDIAYEYWGQGIATKALTNALRIAFRDMGIYRMEAKTMLDNDVSQHILAKFGFKKEGLLRGYRYIRGKHEDILTYALLKNDFPIF